MWRNTVIIILALVHCQEVGGVCPCVTDSVQPTSTNVEMRDLNPKYQNRKKKVGHFWLDSWQGLAGFIYFYSCKRGEGAVSRLA